MGEFNLSKKMLKGSHYYYIPTEDVKEFIRLLKEELNFEGVTDEFQALLVNHNDITTNIGTAIREVIDKLAGDKLI